MNLGRKLWTWVTSLLPKIRTFATWILVQFIGQSLGQASLCTIQESKTIYCMVVLQHNFFFWITERILHLAVHGICGSIVYCTIISSRSLCHRCQCLWCTYLIVFYASRRYTTQNQQLSSCHNFRIRKIPIGHSCEKKSKRYILQATQQQNYYLQKSHLRYFDPSPQSLTHTWNSF